MGNLAIFKGFYYIFSKNTKNFSLARFARSRFVDISVFFMGILRIFLNFPIILFWKHKIFFKIYIFVVKFERNFRKFHLKILEQNNFLLGLNFIFF